MIHVHYNTQLYRMFMNMNNYIYALELIMLNSLIIRNIFKNSISPLVFNNIFSDMQLSVYSALLHTGHTSC